MDQPSPIKSWIHKHSPLKGRNKPLPAPPSDANPTRKPIEPVSGNTSPAKAKTTNKLLSLLKPKSHPVPPPASPPNASTQRTPIHKKTFRSGKGRTPDLRTVSKKISNLEAQLQEAQRQLNEIAAQQQAAQQDEHDVDLEIAQSQETLTQGSRFDGLVENLLEQGSSSHRPVTRRGLPETNANVILDYQAAEAGYEPVQAQVESPQTNQLKRKRSEASWQEMQERIADFQKQQQQQQAQHHLPDSKKVRRTLDPPHTSWAEQQNTKISQPEEAAERDPHDLILGSDSVHSDEEELTALPPIKHHSHYTSASSTPTSSLPASIRKNSRSPFKPTLVPATAPAYNAIPKHPRVAALPKHDGDVDGTGEGAPDTKKPATPSSATPGSSSTTTTASAAQRAKNRRTHVFLPGGAANRLSKVVEEFEWNDEEIF